MIDDVRVHVSRSRMSVEWAAKQALRSELYEHKSWMFYEILQNPDSIIKIGTAFFNRKRIGISVYWDYQKLEEYANSSYARQLGCFIRPEFRRQGIGHALVKRMNEKSAVVGTGLTGSRTFWETVRGDNLRWAIMEKKRKIRGDDPKLNQRKKGKNDRRLDHNGEEWFWQLNGLIVKIRAPNGKAKNFDVSDVLGYVVLDDSFANIVITPYDVNNFISQKEKLFV